MKGVLKWLETKLSRRSATADPEEPDIPVGVGVRAKEDGGKECRVDVEVRFDAKMPSRVVSDGPRKNVLTLDKNVDQEPVTEPRLKILGDSSLDASESIGVDPYNTDRFNTSKTS